MLASDQRPTIVDWALSTGMLLSGLAFIVFGTSKFINGNSFGIVFIVFAILGLLSVKTDFYNYKGKPKEKNYWLIAHLQRMTAGYIAATTAFLVVNFHYQYSIHWFSF